MQHKQTINYWSTHTHTHSDTTGKVFAIIVFELILFWGGGEKKSCIFILIELSFLISFCSGLHFYCKYKRIKKKFIFFSLSSRVEGVIYSLQLYVSIDGVLSFVLKKKWKEGDRKNSQNDNKTAESIELSCQYGSMNRWTRDRHKVSIKCKLFRSK